jgi:energy-coupling factor transport system ATP-binding protein
MVKPIIVNDASFTYPDGTVALTSINYVVNEREFIAFIGQNGSGKTTFAKLISGLLKPTKGSVTIFGKDNKEMKSRELSSLVGYVFQNPDHQLFNMTVYDEIAFGPRNLQLDEGEVKERVYEAAEVAGLNPKLFDESPFFLPKGLRQRCAIASILAMRPKIIIIDEPTTGQDWQQSIQIMEFLKELNRKDHVIIIITHEMEIVAEYAKRTTVFHNGEILMDGVTRDVLYNYDLLKSVNILPPFIPQSLHEYKRIMGTKPLTINEFLELYKSIAKVKV